jgi:predicted  nucleic acid-binding Zn-ribbon protein
MSENIDMSFPDVMTKLYLIWENSEKQKELLQVEVQDYKDSIKQLTVDHTELLKKFESVNEHNEKLEIEINHLKKQVQDVEDDQKQFRKVSHILTMDRENNSYKQQIAILEKRVAFYQNQCNNLKVNDAENKIDKQTETENLMIDMETNTHDIVNDNSEKDLVDDVNAANAENVEDAVNAPNASNASNYDTVPENSNEDEDIDVKEKKIKGVVYYVSDDGDIYIKNEDNSIGELKGKIEHLPSGKTKVKWYKTK